MTTKQTSQPLTPSDEQASGAFDGTHRRLQLADCGPLLSVADLAGVLGIGLKNAHHLARVGRFDHLRASVAIGPRKYSKTLVARWLDGEALTEGRSFGKRRSA